MTTVENPETVAGIFLERLSRFSGLVEVNGKNHRVYIPNSGRMKELLIPGAKTYLSVIEEPHRKTGFDLLMVEYQGQIVSIDSRLPNKIINSALINKDLPQFREFRQVKKEARYSNSRLDFRLDNEESTCYIEVKSVTLVEKGTAMFPDAPTPRGARHLMELVKAVQEGHRGAAIFVIQRNDAVNFKPRDLTDPEFGAALRWAKSNGVEVYACKCLVSRKEIKLDGFLEVLLN